MLFLFFFTKFDQMSRVGSRDRHAGWRSKNYLYTSISNLIHKLHFIWHKTNKNALALEI